MRKRENWIQLGVTCVYEIESELKLLLFSDKYNEVAWCIHIDCCAKADLEWRVLLSLLIRGK